jgi:hypothetical protein
LVTFGSMHFRKKTIIALSIFPQIILVKILSRYPEFVETYYSNGIYPLISKVMRFSLGWLSFSFGDIFYTLSIVFIIRWLFKNFRRIYKDTKNWFVDVMCALSIIYLMFHLMWGFNYYRLPLNENLNLARDYSTEQLEKVTSLLIDKTNKIHLSILNNDSLMVEMPYSKFEMMQMASEGHNALSKTYPHLEYHPKSIKKSLFSLPLSYMGFSGYLNPITLESQVNYMIPKFRIPTTSSHEIAHQLGYAAENEANFIGSLAAMQHPDVYFRYSGHAFALQYCINELYRRNPEQAKILIKQLNYGIRLNYQEAAEFWEAHQNPLEPLFKSTYETYLQANNQSDGMKSYSYVVALLVNYFDNQLSKE